MRIVNTLLGLGLLLLLTACGSKQKKIIIFVDNEFLKENTVMLDDTIQLTFDGGLKESLQPLLVQRGPHSVKINDGAVQNFEANSHEGILNVAGTDFYMYPIEYVAENSIQSIAQMRPVEAPIVYDSTIVYDKQLAENQAALVKQLKNEAQQRSLKSKADKVIAGSQLFIAKKWDLGLDEDPPEQIEMDGSYMSVSKLLPLQLYVLLARLSEDYVVETIEEEELMGLVNELYGK
ncbi:MAG: hypothetical protein AAFO94_08085 [Bacteroidota bacterium]